jgi:GTPase SAR1 family protein
LYDNSSKPEDQISADAAIRGSAAYLLVYAIDDRKSFEKLDQLHERVKGLARVPRIVVVGTKSDSLNREVTEEEGKAWADRIGAKFIECSAKDNENVEMVFIRVLETITGTTAVIKKKRVKPPPPPKKKCLCCEFQ